MKKIVDLPSRSTHSQDVNIQTALVINSIHVRLRIMTEIERILTVCGATQAGIKATCMRRLVLRNLGLPWVEHKVVTVHQIKNNGSN